MNLSRVKELGGKTIDTLKNDGLKSLAIKGKNFIKFKIMSKYQKYDKCFKDILFINGCSLPHPQRYRVDHQIEQLESAGISCAKVDYDKVTLDLVRFFRGFVIYRCPITPTIEEFIKIAKENNKVTFYDIDDLVFDIKDTKTVKFLDTMSEDERNLYNDGVIRMGKTLKLCDYGIASTDRLQTEMKKHLKEVYINRNVASEVMIGYSKKALVEVSKSNDKIIMGYLSGSITHNNDFKLIMPNIIRAMKKHSNLYLQVVGLLDVPDEMLEFKDRIIFSHFVDWTKLPMLIRSIDINLAPLEQSIFNEAKSENKWTEAALVKIPTIASDVGAFKSQIVDGKTGLLCKTKKDWDEKLEKLILSKELRESIGLQAYNEAMENHVTIKTGTGLRDFIMHKLNKNISFVLPSTNVSGGIMVATKHAIILKNNGYDVTMININKETEKVDKIYEKNEYINVVPVRKTEFLQHVDEMVATMWLTLKYVKKYTNCFDKRYLVQGYETDLYKEGSFERIECEETYNDTYPLKYLTISKWCKNWLKSKYHRNVKYAPNGIDLSLFNRKNRKFNKKIKILIEGNCEDYYKNVDESFKITNKLDKNKYEIYYLSYQKKPKKWYYVDKFYHAVPHDEVGKIYEECDILIKSSLLESFSYPPLEMMATGGISVVVPNSGNVEYLKDGENCLLYKQGDIEDAISKIKKICMDEKLREKLIKGGIKTVSERKWENIEKEVLSLYE